MKILASRPVWLIGLMMLSVGMVVVVGLGSTVEDADAARKRIVAYARDADKLDAKDSTEFAAASSAPLWAHVNSNGTLVRGNGANTSGRLGVGQHYVNFNRDVSFCGYVATSTDAYATPTGTLQGASYGQPREVTVYTVDSTGTRVDVPFHLVVTC
jgi:hypothetical protein